MKSEILMRIDSLQINPGHVEQKRRLSAALIKSCLCVLVHQSIFAKSTWKQILNSSNKGNDYQNPLYEILNTLRYKLYNLGPCCVDMLCQLQLSNHCCVFSSASLCEINMEANIELFQQPACALIVNNVGGLDPDVSVLPT